MAEIVMKYSKLTDPWTCPIETLKAEIDMLDNKVGYHDTEQLAIKKFINSVYGALGSKYFVAYNVYMAESITAQGRDLNHFSENSVNRYFSGIFQSNPKITIYYQWVHTDADGNEFTFESEEKPSDYYNSGTWKECQKWSAAVKKGKKLTPELKECLQNNSVGQCDWLQTQVDLFTKLGLDKNLAETFDLTKGITTYVPPLTDEEHSYLDGDYSLCKGGDTDSVSGDTVITVDGKEMTIEEFFNTSKIENNDIVMKSLNGSDIVPTASHKMLTYSPKYDKIVSRNVNYVMRHKVSKARYKITTESGKCVIVTGDHSCMVVRDNELISVKACEILPTDKIITINKNGNE